MIELANSDTSDFILTIKEWSNQTTIHGISHIFHSKNIFFRKIYILSFAVSFAILTLNFYQSILDYFSFDVNTQIEV